MTTNILEAIKQAYSAGLTDGARQAEVIARIHAEHAKGTQGLSVGDSIHVVTATSNGARKRPGRVAKAATPNKVPAKASGGLSKAHGTRKARGPREKGVKERIVNLIAAEPMTVSAIIEHTGFKATSVRATLMSLKKAGLAGQYSEGGWSAIPPPHDSGNSGAEAANV